MRGLITWLSRFALLRRVVQICGLHHLGNWWLGHFPRVRRLPTSGVIYRATRLESIPLAAEMFDQGTLYEAGLLPPGVETFADLGCNVGYFTCWLGHVTGGRALKGVMLDANAEAVAEARWHAAANRWTEVYAVHGIVGEGGPDGTSDFYLYESNICSTSQPPDQTVMDLKGTWTKVRVPAVRVGQLWREHFGSTRCHLLKVDVEGSEMNFLEQEGAFLEQVDAILIEWHKWRVSLDEVRRVLESHRFRLVKVLEETDQLGTAYFDRSR